MCSPYSVSARTTPVSAGAESYRWTTVSFASEMRGAPSAATAVFSGAVASGGARCPGHKSEHLQKRNSARALANGSSEVRARARPHSYVLTSQAPRLITMRGFFPSSHIGPCARMS